MHKKSGTAKTRTKKTTKPAKAQAADTGKTAAIERGFNLLEDAKRILEVRSANIDNKNYKPEEGFLLAVVKPETNTVSIYGCQISHSGKLELGQAIAQKAIEEMAGEILSGDLKG